MYPDALLTEKLRLLRQAGILAYPGGTFLELARVQGRAEPFIQRAQELGFPAIEISDGALPLAVTERYRLIRLGRDLGLTVLSEVGSKDPDGQPAAADLRRQAEADLEAGVDFVVVEARESGRQVGIYDAEGRICPQALADVARNLPGRRLIWEAPDRSQQAELIRRLGPRVNLGNVPPVEALALEALRRGWRADTIPSLPVSSV